MKSQWGIIAATIMLANTAYAEWPHWDDTKVYLGAEVGKSQSKMVSGGFNTAGPHENTNNDKETENLFSAKIGAELKNGLRFDIAYRQYENQNYTTDSFMPPTPTFFYNSKIKSKSVMVTAYYNFYKYNKVDFYEGVGIGVSRSKISVNDTVVEGSGSDTDFSWQVELGADYPLTDALTFSAGLRYINLGKAKTNLQLISSGIAAGDFTADISSKEAFIGLRYSF